jgi:hypothetical protein
VISMASTFWDLGQLSSTIEVLWRSDCLQVNRLLFRSQDLAGESQTIMFADKDLDEISYRADLAEQTIHISLVIFGQKG